MRYSSSEQTTNINSWAPHCSIAIILHNLDNNIKHKTLFFYIVSSPFFKLFNLIFSTFTSVIIWGFGVLGTDDCLRERRGRR